MSKVLIIDNSPDSTGAFKAILANVKDLSIQHQFYFAIPKGSKNGKELEKSGIDYRSFPFREISRRPLDLLLYLPMLLINGFRISKWAKREEIDIIHSNDLYNLSALVAKIFIHVIVFTHIRRMPESFPSFIYRTWVKIHSRFSDQILAVSIANGKIFKDTPQLIVLYDRLPLHEKMPSYLVSDSSPISLLYLANYTRGKGQEHAIEVLNQLGGVAENYKLTFVGGDLGMEKNKNFKYELMEIAKKYGLDELVHFENKTEDVEGVMKAHDVVLNFSDSESFSRVSLEALHYGLPLIATDVGGTSEMFINGESGYLVDRKNIEAMKTAIENISRIKVRKRFSMNSKKFVVENFSMDKTSGKLGKLYTELS